MKSRTKERTRKREGARAFLAHSAEKREKIEEKDQALTKRQGVRGNETAEPDPGSSAALALTGAPFWSLPPLMPGVLSYTATAG